MGESFNRMQFFHLNGAKLTDFTKIVSAKVNQHIMFGQLLFICKQLCFQCFIFLIVFSSRSGTSERKGVKYTIFQLYQGLRRSACNLDIRS